MMASGSSQAAPPRWWQSAPCTPAGPPPRTRRRPQAQATQRAREGRLTSCASSVRNDEGVAGREIHRGASFERLFVIEANRLLGLLASLVRAAEDVDVLGVGEILQSAGHRERLEN